MRRLVPLIVLLGLIVIAASVGSLSLAQVGEQAAPTPTIGPTQSSSATPQASPTNRSFWCNCWMNGQPSAWGGRVSASNYFQAALSAQGQCAGYLGSTPAPAYIPTPSSNANGLIMPTPFAFPLNPCQNCACN